MGEGGRIMVALVLAAAGLVGCHVAYSGKCEMRNAECGMAAPGWEEKRIEVAPDADCLAIVSAGIAAVAGVPGAVVALLAAPRAVGKLISSPAVVGDNLTTRTR